MCADFLVIVVPSLQLLSQEIEDCESAFIKLCSLLLHDLESNLDKVGCQELTHITSTWPPKSAYFSHNFDGKTPKFLLQLQMCLVLSRSRYR